MNLFNLLQYGAWGGTWTRTLRRIPDFESGASTNSTTQAFSGAPGRSRTHNPLIRSQMLYPIEPQMHIEYLIRIPYYFFYVNLKIRVVHFISCTTLLFKDYFSSTKPSSFALCQAKKWASPTFSNFGDSFEQISVA